MRNIQMAKGAHTVVNRCARVKPGETVVIVTEPSRMSIARSWERRSARRAASRSSAASCPASGTDRSRQPPQRRR